MVVKNDNIIRIGFQNFNGFSGRENDPIDKSLHKWITEWDFDIFGISEVNLFWPNVKQGLQFLNRLFQWFNPTSTRAHCSFKKNEHRTKRSIRQYGGTGQIARGNASLRHNGNEDDPTGLGRWVSQWFLGKDQRVLRVVTAYRPVQKREANLYSVFRQHWAAFEKEGRNVDPREALLEDLTIAINKWRKAGEQVVLMMDGNEDVRSDRISRFLQQVGMREAILERHGAAAAPHTHIKGSVPIDGIFVTTSLQIVAGGYSAFDEGVKVRRADHRCLWIDIRTADVFGHTMPGPCKFAGRRVNGKDPRTYKIFLAEYRERVLKNRLSQRIFSLEQRAVYPLPPHLQKEAETNAKLRNEAIQGADHKCRQLHFGGAAFTPEFSRLEVAVKTLDLLIHKRNRRKISSSLIKRQHKKSEMQITLSQLYSLDLPALQKKAAQMYKAYRRYWINQDVARDNWLTDLAQSCAKAEEQRQQKKPKKRQRPNHKEKTMAQRTSAQIKSLPTEEKNRNLWARIKQGVGKSSLAGVSMVIAPDENGEMISHTKHSDITTALIQEHRRKYHQTEHTPPMQAPLKDELGYLGTGPVAEAILTDRYMPSPGTDEAAATLLRHMQRVEPEWQDTPVGISTQDFQTGWRVMKERTSAGGKVLHFGHCKAIALDDELSSMEASFLSLPLKSGYVYSTWKQGIDCVLPKKKNELKVSALRTIVLLEADFNFLNKHIARKVMMRLWDIGRIIRRRIMGGTNARRLPRKWSRPRNLGSCQLPVLQILREEGYGAFFKAAISGEDIQLVGYAFVDDTDLIQTGHNPTVEYRQVIEKAQQALDRWEKLISATGGALLVAKCRWWAVDFEWNENGSWQYRRDVEIPGKLRANDFDGVRKEVKRLDTDEAYETLGVFLAPTGNHTVEYEYLQGKAQKWADRLRTSTFHDREAATALKATILKTLEYPLPAIFLTEIECKKLMSIVLKAALPKAKFNRNTCRKTLYAPGSHGGQDISNLYTAQIIVHADTVIRHGSSNTISGQQFQATIQLAKVEAGLSGPLFQNSYKKYGHLLTDSWIKRAWAEFNTTQLQVVEESECLELSREGDKLLIPTFYKNGFCNSTLAKLNMCKNRIQVFRVSDIVSGNGERLLEAAYNDHFPFPNQTVSWPTQGALPASYWRLWKRAIKKSFPATRSGQLHSLLGKWKVTKYPDRVDAWHNRNTHMTYVRHTTGWLKYSHTLGGNNGEIASHKLVLRDQTPPEQAQRAVAWVSNGALQYHGSGPIEREDDTEPHTLQQAIAQVHKDWYWAIEHIEWTIDPEEIAHAIRSGTARAITDGSFKNSKGTAAFAIVNQTCKRGIYCMQRTPGPEYAQCSYRSENGGIVGILLLLKLLDQAYSLQGGSIVIGCDNIESGRHCLQYTEPLRPTIDHYDILAAARELRNNLPFKPSYRHVEGHQRTKYPRHTLDEWAELNEEMDGLAKAYWRHTETLLRPIKCRPKEWTVVYKKQRIITKFTSRLRRAIEGHKVEEKWLTPSGSRRNPTAPKLTLRQLQAIDMDTIQLAWDKISMPRQRFITKFITGQLPTGRRMQQYKFWESSRCPLCNIENETTDHVFMCPDGRAIQARKEAIATFNGRLQAIHTATDIRQSIIMLISNRLLKEPLERQAIERTEVRQLIGRQIRIGPLALLQGWVCYGWEEAQQKAFRNYAPWRSGSMWIQIVIKELWELAFSLWENRNRILHEKEENHPDIDTNNIDLQVLEEWTIGPESNWDRNQRSLFQGITCEEILAKPIHMRIQWIYYIQLARGSIPSEDR